MYVNVKQTRFYTLQVLNILTPCYVKHDVRTITPIHPTVLPKWQIRRKRVFIKSLNNSTCDHNVFRDGI